MDTQPFPSEEHVSQGPHFATVPSLVLHGVAVVLALVILVGLVAFVFSGTKSAADLALIQVTASMLGKHSNIHRILDITNDIIPRAIRIQMVAMICL